MAPDLFSHNGAGASIYGAMLLLSAILVQVDIFQTAGIKTVLVIRIFGQWAILQRTAPQVVAPTNTPLVLLRRGQQLLQNKYVVWTCMFIVVCHVRRNLDSIPLVWVQVVWALTLVLCVALGYYKTQLELNSSNSKDLFEGSSPATAPKIKAV